MWLSGISPNVSTCKVAKSAIYIEIKIVLLIPLYTSLILYSKLLITLQCNICTDEYRK